MSDIFISYVNSNSLMTTTTSYEQLSTPERSYGPSLAEQCPTPVSNHISAPGADVNMLDTKVANINTNGGRDSLEDIPVFEVVTEYQNTPQSTVANYPHIFLQLCDGQIINVKNGEIIIRLSQFVAPNGLVEPLQSDTTSIFSSQASPRPLHTDSEYMTSTQESNYQQETSIDML